MSAAATLLARAAAAYPRRSAVESLTGERVTYAELGDRAERVRCALERRGVTAGTRVGLSLGNTPDALAAIYGILAAGATCVPVDPDSPPLRHAAVLEDCAVGVALADPRLAVALREAAPTITIIADRGRGLIAALEEAPGETRAASASRDVAFIQYTSGSTGKPKGVMLSHANVEAVLDWYAHVAQAGAEDRFASHAPWQFSVTLYNAFLPATCGAAVVLVDERVRRAPRALVRAVTDARVSRWMCAPSVLRVMVQHGEVARGMHRLAPLQLSGGEVLQPTVVAALRDLFPTTMLRGIYASTETSGCTLYEPAARAGPRGAPPSIGTAAFGVEMRTVDEAGHDLSGSVGELWISGPAVTMGYWNNPALDAAAFSIDGAGRRWFRSCDLALRESDGTLRFVGRADRTVKKRGYRVALEEVEARLAQHQAVVEVAVVAVPHDELGTKLVAFVVLRPGERPSYITLKTFCAAALPAYMLPDTIVRLAALPKTPSGKIDLQALQREAS